MITAPERAEGAIHPRHGWLAAAIPISAERFRVSDSDLAATLSAASAQIVDANPDVEILTARELHPSAPWVVVNVDHVSAPTARNDATTRAGRARRRVAISLRARAEARAVRRRLLQLGYRSAAVVPWDLEQPLPLPYAPGDERPSVAERFPRSAFVLGVRDGRGRTALDEVVEQAELCASAIRARPLVRESGLVVVGGSSVLRTTVGQGVRSIEAQAGALKQLRRASSGALLKRIPRLLHRGRSGLVDWSLEERLVGRQPACPLPSATLRDCLEFLVALQLVGNGGRRGGPAEDARIVAAACTAADGAAICRIGLQLESRLASLPRGFGHGDFWGGNLLVGDDGRLTGVIDWEHAAEGRLPLLDLLHLELNANRPPSPDQWGTAVANRLLPWARSGGNELARRYCERVGLVPAAPLLVELVVAYWLNRLAFEVGTYSDRPLRRTWTRNNVERVLREADALIT